MKGGIDMSKNWYESSIKSLVEEFMRDHGYPIVFDTTKFFDDEVERWTKNLSEPQKQRVVSLAKQAREYAFNQKYGTYNYKNDYRSECSEWHFKFLKKILEYVPRLNGLRILSVGSNNGRELYDIFQDYYNAIAFDVVEISKTAVENGKKLFPKINFICQSMDTFEPKHDYYDIYLNLRVAYCAGNDLNNIVRKAYDSLKINGIIIFSISNGYIDTSNSSRNIVKGIYNPTTRKCSDYEMNRNLEWVRKAILLNGFRNVEIYDVDSEILLISKKQ